MVANSKRQRSDFIADRMWAAMSIMGGDTIAPPARPYKLEVAVAEHAHSSASWAKFTAIRFVNRLAAERRSGWSSNIPIAF
jgi:hypothetical protein